MQIFLAIYACIFVKCVCVYGEQHIYKDLIFHKRKAAQQPLSFNRIILAGWYIAMTEAVFSMSQQETPYIESLRNLVKNATESYPKDLMREHKFEIACKLWGEGTPIKRNLAALSFLSDLGITLTKELEDTLRVHPSVFLETKRAYFPAILAAVRDLSGEFVGIHRTFFCKDGNTWVQAAKPRMLGYCFGSFIQLQKCVSHKLIVTTGLETGLMMQLACPDIPVWVAMTRGNIRSLLPPSAHELIFCIDNDANDPYTAQRILDDAIRIHRDRGQCIRIAHMPINWRHHSFCKAD